MPRLLTFAVVIAACCLTSGCQLLGIAWQTTVAEPVQSASHHYERVSRRQFRRLAEQALEQAMVDARAAMDDYFCDPFSIDYQEGFVDGFVDYLEAGGSGNPPPLPPRRYWKAKHQNPAGFQAIDEWFQGFRHGAAVAQASNYRSFVTIPLSDAATMDTIPYGYGRISTSDNVPEELPEEVLLADQRIAQGLPSESGPMASRLDAPQAAGP
jgi:hypothetical protein